MTRDPRREPPPQRHSDRHTRTRPRRRRPRYTPPASVERRRRLLSRFTLIFGVLVGVSAIAIAVIDRSEDSGTGDPAVGPPAPADAVSVRVVEIIDGDTLVVDAAGDERFTVRLFGVDTPEVGDPCYAEATARLAALAGDTVLLLPDVRLQDVGGRELRYVFSEDGASIDAALLDEGLAIAWRRDGAFRDELIALEEAASAAETGCLWSG